VRTVSNPNTQKIRLRAYFLYDIVIFCHNATMSTPRTRRSRVFTISFPEKLAEQVIAHAEEENRTISELFREAYRSYHMERNERKLIAARAEAAQRSPNNYTEDDIEGFVDEIRGDLYRQRMKTA
jgi:hypothetical protein